MTHPTTTPPVPATAPAKKKSKWRYVLYFFGSLMLLRACAGLGSSDEKTEATSQHGAPIATQRSSGDKAAGVIGQAYATRYFEVTVHGVERVARIVTNDEIVDQHFIEQNVSSDVSFLVIDASYRNTDTESRTITAGDVIVRTPDGKSYTFDNAETVPAKGWQLALETINPLMSHRTKMVYKLPTSLRGEVLFKPHNRASKDQVIALGRL